MSVYAAMFGSDIYPAEDFTDVQTIVQAGVWEKRNCTGRGVLFQRAISLHYVPYDMWQPDKPQATALAC